MKTVFYKRFLSAVCIFILSIVTMILPVVADGGGSVKFLYVKDNVEFQIYRVGSSKTFKLEGVFEKYEVDLERESAAVTLAAYIERDKISPTSTALTGKDNTVYFNNIAEGIYIITGESCQIGNSKYTAMPSLVAIDGNKVEIIGKYEKTDIPHKPEIPDTKKLSVMKVWSGTSREDKVTVQLLKDGNFYDEVILNGKNNWRYTWTNIDIKASWSVVETDVPSKYKVSIEKDGDVFVIVNYYKPSGGGGTVTATTTEAATEVTTTGNFVTTEASAETTTSYHRPYEEVTESTTLSAVSSVETPTPPYDESNEGEGNTIPYISEIPNGATPNDNTTLDADTTSEAEDSSTNEALPQTGQLWYPVPILSFLGMLCIIIGIFEKQREICYEKNVQK